MEARDASGLNGSGRVGVARPVQNTIRHPGTLQCGRHLAEKTQRGGSRGRKAGGNTSSAGCN